MHKSLIRLCCIASIVLLTACARSPVLSPVGERLPERVELTDVPFFPQDAFQCGPAALATMLNQRGVLTTPGALKDKVYIPSREGSLQVEMVAAARNHEMLVYPLQPRLEAVLAEVAAGNPVLVLQNLALPGLPRWHYAIVIGVDAKRVTLRSGRRDRLTTSQRSFLRSWDWAGRGASWRCVPVSGRRSPNRGAGSRRCRTSSRWASRRRPRPATRPRHCKACRQKQGGNRSAAISTATTCRRHPPSRSC